MIALGTRLSDFTTASKSQFQNPDVRFASINVDPYDAHKHGALAVVADLKITLEELAASLSGFRIDADYEHEIQCHKEAWEKTYREITVPTAGKGLTQAQVIRALNERLDEKSTIVHAAGGLPGDLHKLWKGKAQGDYHSEYGYSCMGYEIAGALGVKMAAPEREIYALLGDGSYLMLNHEIVTSVQEGRKITLVLLDNRGYQCIHNLQKSCGSRGFGNEFRYRQGPELSGDPVEVDFVANARSLGAKTFQVDSEAALVSALAAAKKEPGTCMIYVPIENRGGLPGYSWWDVPVAEVSGSSAVLNARKAYEEVVRHRQKFYYRGDFR